MGKMLAALLTGVGLSILWVVLMDRHDYDACPRCIAGALNALDQFFNPRSEETA